MENFTPVSATLGGILIGISAVIMMWGKGRITGIAGIASGMLGRFDGDWIWRGAFLAGLFLAPVLWKAAGQEIAVPEFTADGIWLVIGGLCVGYGTQLGSGCTSGHGVCGISRFSPRSIVATLTFMTTGIVTVYLFRHVFGG